MKIALLVRSDTVERTPALEMELVSLRKYAENYKMFEDFVFIVKNSIINTDYILKLTLREYQIEKMSFEKYNPEIELLYKEKHCLIPIEEMKLRKVISERLFFKTILKSEFKSSDLWCCQPSSEFIFLLPYYYLFIKLLEFREKLTETLEFFDLHYLLI